MEVKVLPCLRRMGVSEVEDGFLGQSFYIKDLVFACYDLDVTKW